MTPPSRSEARVHRIRSRTAIPATLVLLGSVSFLVACGGGAPAQAPQRVTPQGTQTPAIFGYVLRIGETDAGQDTTRVVGANVYLPDLQIRVQSDSTGYWRIDEGLVPSRYRVEGSLGAEVGALEVDVVLGERGPFDIVLGEEGSAPPPLSDIETRPGGSDRECRGTRCVRN